MKELDKLFEGRNIVMHEDNGKLFFEIESVAMAIGYITKAKGKEYIHKTRMNKTLKNAEISTVVHGVQLFMTEDQLYLFLIEAHTEKSKEFQKWVTTEVLPTINKMGGYIESGREEEMVSKYFPSFSKEIQTEMVNDLIRQNSELKEFYNDLMSTEGLMSMNTAAKELKIGEYKLFAFLRSHKVLFYDKDRVNVPYQRFMNEEKFAVKETPCHDGEMRSVTYATKKGLDYMRKLLRKHGYYESVA